MTQAMPRGDHARRDEVLVFRGDSLVTEGASVFPQRRLRRVRRVRRVDQERDASHASWRSREKR